MIYFQKLSSGIEVFPLMNAIQRTNLWGMNTLRTTHPDSPHRQSSDIWLRFNDVKDEATVVDDLESINYPAFWLLPVRQMIFSLMAKVEGERLGRALITKLAPGKRIDPHEDFGKPASYYDRYHIVLNGLPGSLFRCGNETVQMLSGDCWWFDNTVEHEAINNSADDRVHMIVDIRTSR